MPSALSAHAAAGSREAAASPYTVAVGVFPNEEMCFFGSDDARRTSVPAKKVHTSSEDLISDLALLQSSEVARQMHGQSSLTNDTLSRYA